MKRYIVDMSKLPIDERQKLYDELDGWSHFLTPYNKQIGVYEVFWDSSHSIEKIISFPKEVVISLV